MLLRDKLEKTGDLLFRYRSHLPLFLVVLLVLERRHFHSIANNGFIDACFELFCLMVSLGGFLIRVYTVAYSRRGTSGRNTRGQWAQSLNTDGLYSIFRNPLYAGNLFVVLGLTMLSQSLELIAITLLLYFCFYVPIILREEAFLKQQFGKEFEQYAERTPALLPNFRLWKKPALAANFIRILYREHDTFMGIMGGFYAIKLLKDFTIQHKIIFNPVWTAVFCLSLLLWMILKAAKKHLKSIDSHV